MAHWKKITKHPFKARISDTLTEKNTIDIHKSNNKSRLMESFKPSVIAPQDDISLAQLPPTSDENFENSQIDKDTDATKTYQIQQLTNIENPHEHDVLLGRGNFFSYHPGNVYFRNLVEKHLLQYVSSCKSEKPNYANLIIDEVSMRSPPGRFLRQDLDTKLWHSVDHKKALDKTRQALREGFPDMNVRGINSLDPDGFENSTCSSGEKVGLQPNSQDHFSRTNAQSALVVPYHIGSMDSSTLETTPVVNPAPHIRPQALSKQISFRVDSYPKVMNSAETSNEATSRMSPHNNVHKNSSMGISSSATKILASEQLANAVAARLLKSQGIVNENIENLVALGILAALNGGIKGYSSDQKSFPPTQADGPIGTPDEVLESSIIPNTNTPKTYASTDDSLVSAVASGVAKMSELSTLVKSSKRQLFSRQVSDYNVMSNKRWKSATSLEQPFDTKDSSGAEALLAFSNGNEESSKGSSNDESTDDSEKNDTVNNVVPPPHELPLPISKQNSNGIWSTPSLGNFMQCDTCLGAGILPLPSSTMSNLHGASKNLLSNDTSIARSSIGPNEILQNINTESLVPASDTLHTSQRNSTENDSLSNEFYNSSSNWTDKIRQVELKWGIPLDESKNFSQRVEAIESKALNCRNVLFSASKSTALEETGEKELSTINTSRTEKEVEMAEKKWGLSPPEGYNLTDRIEMIEQTAYSFVKRLTLWN